LYDGLEFLEGKVGVGFGPIIGDQALASALNRECERVRLLLRRHRRDSHRVDHSFVEQKSGLALRFLLSASQSSVSEGQSDRRGQITGRHSSLLGEVAGTKVLLKSRLAAHADNRYQVTETAVGV
jgi:hypothetical protein